MRKDWCRTRGVSALGPSLHLVALEPMLHAIIKLDGSPRCGAGQCRCCLRAVKRSYRLRLFLSPRSPPRALSRRDAIAVSSVSNAVANLTSAIAISIGTTSLLKEGTAGAWKRAPASRGFASCRLPRARMGRCLSNRQATARRRPARLRRVRRRFRQGFHSLAAGEELTPSCPRERIPSPRPSTT